MSDEDALRQLYRQLPAEEPAASLDAQVLAAVNAELAAARERRAKWQQRWRYQVPLATAATLLLAVGLLLHEPATLMRRSDVTYESSDREGRRQGTVAERADSDEAGAVAESRLRMAPPVSAPASAPPPPPPAPAPVPPPIVVPAPAIVAAPAVAPESAPALAAEMSPQKSPSAPTAPDNDVSARKRLPNVVMGIVAPEMLARLKLEGWLAEAPGMAAPEFCARLRLFWEEAAAQAGTGTGTTPDCPTTDGEHAWPAPLLVTWRVAAGHVQSAELRR